MDNLAQVGQWDRTGTEGGTEDRPSVAVKNAPNHNVIKGYIFEFT